MTATPVSLWCLISDVRFDSPPAVYPDLVGFIVPFFFFFPKGVRKRAFFIVLISEITRCIYEMALVNQWDNVREGYEGLKMEGVAKKCRFQVGVRDNILISSSNLSFRMLPC